MIIPEKAPKTEGFGTTIPNQFATIFVFIDRPLPTYTTLKTRDVTFLRPRLQRTKSTSDNYDWPQTIEDTVKKRNNFVLKVKIK